MSLVPSLSVIEFPGVLRDPHQPRAAIECLGGERAVRQATTATFHTTSSSPTLNLRPGPHSSPSNIHPEKPIQSTNLFLLELETELSTHHRQDQDLILSNTQQHTTANPNPRARIIGRIDSLTRYRSLADYAYHATQDVQPPLSNDTAANQVAANCIFRALFQTRQHHCQPHTLLDRLRPRRFARASPDYGNTDYWFRQYSYGNAKLPTNTELIPDRPLGDDRRSHANRIALLHHRVSPHITKVPDGPLHEHYAPVLRAKSAYHQCLSLVKNLFQVRPIWVRRALQEGIPQELASQFKRVITQVAYAFQGAGPFYQAWIRYGYDPRKDSTSRKYQTFEIRITNAVIIAARFHCDELEEKERLIQKDKQQEDDQLISRDKQLGKQDRQSKQTLHEFENHHSTPIAVLSSSMKEGDEVYHAHSDATGVDVARNEDNVRQESSDKSGQATPSAIASVRNESSFEKRESGCKVGGGIEQKEHLVETTATVEKDNDDKEKIEELMDEDGKKSKILTCTLNEHVLNKECKESGEKNDMEDLTNVGSFHMPASFTLSRIPRKRNNIIQVCDITLPEVVQACNEEMVTEKFDKRFGFFTQAGHERVMQAIKSTLLMMSKERLGEERTKQILKGDYSSVGHVMINRRRRLFLKDVMRPRKRTAKGISKKKTMGRLRRFDEGVMQSEAVERVKDLVKEGEGEVREEGERKATDGGSGNEFGDDVCGSGVGNGTEEESGDIDLEDVDGFALLEDEEDDEDDEDEYEDGEEREEGREGH